jgi:predicted dehydrogenase
VTPPTAHSPVPVILVGCGAVSRLFYLPSLRELARHGILKTVAVVDPAAAARNAIAGELHATPCATLAEGLAAGARLAIIATPPKFHREQVEAAFAAGLDVLCEKPLASSVADGEAMLAAAARTGRTLAAGHYKRFFPAHRALKRLIERQTFGPLRSVDLHEGGRFSWPAATDSFFRKEQTPGGVLLDIGVHVLDLLLWWLGEPQRFTYADDADGGLEANCRFDATFPGDVRVCLRLSRDWPTPNCYVFRFERATLHCRVNASNQLELTLDDLPMTFAAELRDPVSPATLDRTTALESNPQAFIAQLADVCAAVRDARPPFIPGAEGLRPLRLIGQCYQQRLPLPQPWLAAQP